jgi:hypothetical protein
LLEVRLAVLTEMLNYLSKKGLSGKHKFNIMSCLRTALDWAWRAEKIISVPPFPKKNLYNLQQAAIQWLPSDRQAAVLQKIPYEHQPAKISFEATWRGHGSIQRRLPRR